MSIKADETYFEYLEIDLDFLQIVWVKYINPERERDKGERIEKGGGC